MSNPNPSLQFHEKLLGFAASQRTMLFMSGLVIASLGVAAVIAPIMLASSVLWIVGILFLSSGVINILQWISGRLRGGHEVQGLPVIAGHVALNFSVGFVLIFRHNLSLILLAVLIGTLLLLDGLIQILVGLRIHGWKQKTVLFISGGLTCGLAVCAAMFSQEPGEGDRLAFVIGMKMLLFGSMLSYLAWIASDATASQTYGAPDPEEVDKLPGEAYAVFIGNSFHLGVYVGEDRVVDFRDDNMVYQVTWEQFLLGRHPQHWEYPDLPAVPPEQVCEFALDKVGQDLKYNFFKFNCEHFAIWCKTLGELKASRYAQVNSAFDNVSEAPLLGTMVELYSRAVEFIIFKFGGITGKKTSLWLRDRSALVSRWILNSRLLKREQKAEAAVDAGVEDRTESATEGDV